MRRARSSPARSEGRGRPLLPLTSLAERISFALVTALRIFAIDRGRFRTSPEADAGSFDPFSLLNLAAA